MAQIRTAAPGYPRLLPRVDSLGYFVGLTLGELEETIRLRRESGLRSAIDVVRSDRGAESIAEVGRLLDSLDSEQSSAAAGGEAAAAAQQRMVLLSLATAALLAALLAPLISAPVARRRSRASYWRSAGVSWLSLSCSISTAL